MVFSYTTDLLLNRFARTGWQAIEAQWEQGEIGSKVCMQQQIALLDMSVQEFQQCLDEIEIDQGLITLIDAISAHNIKLTVVSDGLDAVIDYMLKKHQLNHLNIIANHLIQADERHWQLQFPYAQPHCISKSGTCKCSIAALNQQKIILIGDGRSDFCLAEQADFVFAKKSLIQHCASQQIQHHAFEQLSELIQPLLALLQHHAIHQQDRLVLNS
ncbi:HAD superfamily phosphoserine phosphatase-like hydrolase/2,3-diketo-5-methylthio-1-phosphopentane phosphatase [Acinetobacter calcoaceticus]|uniref:HAD superfamily phosphoserine phosphatase-like hydrolase/2,3-diketo-5-methylthio-1-phosphopentane phosphatase n=1 Tax=Acinetobacter calcoaceticus TaxID=471 RepID=A0A4R1XNL9_ACICA|nr:HAD superfamily phosphoserine phosphatase-like hydrolase/2,3-diketo-5-methylthio-1-phosphopentane phosphatase [Acinetobacter calcoaceticus]